MNNRVSIFIDGSNLSIAVKKTFGRRVDYPPFIKKLVGDRSLMRAYYYEAPLLKEVDTKSYEGQQSFFEFLRRTRIFEIRLGHRVKRSEQHQCPTCNAVFSKDTFAQKGVDSLMVLDLLSLAARNAYDIAILVSGDQDFTYVISEVRMLGKTVENAFTETDWAPSLKIVSDKTIILNKDFLNDCLQNEKAP